MSVSKKRGGKVSTNFSTAGKKTVMVAVAAVAVISGVLMAVGMITPAINTPEITATDDTG